MVNKTMEDVLSFIFDKNKIGKFPLLAYTTFELLKAIYSLYCTFARLRLVSTTQVDVASKKICTL